MPKKEDIKKILVIGSGPIVIGQAAEFDYAGTQACQALREEGYEVVLVNSNPATIMTDPDIADKVYIEPITLEAVTQVIRKEKPQGLLPTLGGQTGLNMAMELHRHGVLEEHNITLLGTSLHAIEKAEDRDLFRNLMNELNQPVPESDIVCTLEAALAFAERVPYPLIIRPAYTLGGTGGGIANTEAEYIEIVTSGLKYSPITQVLVEKSIAGCKEIEYEVMRDSNDNCIVVCNMENFDPVGVHTGDSIVVAPSQTLSDKEYQMLRTASLDIIRALKIEGGCNVQYALDPDSFNYYVIEVNPRVSRSSALASKATGYPIAKVAAKISIGMTLDEIVNPVTKETFASFEPALDYIVTKIPRWPFDKFVTANRTLGTQMKATGEVMAIGRTFEESLQKAIRSLEVDYDGLYVADYDQLETDVLLKRIAKADDERLFQLAELFRRGISVETIHQATKIDRFFLHKLLQLVEFEQIFKDVWFDNYNQELAELAGDNKQLRKIILQKAKQLGFTDRYLARLVNCKEENIRFKRNDYGIKPVYKMVDTCAAEFAAYTPYFYSSYEREDECQPSNNKKIIVLGSGPIRIGQGIEFDYASVHAVWAIKEAGYEAIIINNNPETVSTDFSTSDRLYFEPLYLEDVIEIIEKEKPDGVIVQFGGQTAINLAEPLAELNIPIIGTTMEDINTAEDREKFEQLLNKLQVPRPAGETVFTVEQAVDVANKLSYPVLVRPSYVLGGRAMEIVHNEEDLLDYMSRAVKLSSKHPVLIDRYMIGMEVEVDAVSDGETVLIPGIMEHIERAGVHSGDSIAVYPPQKMTIEVKQQIIDYTTRLALSLNTKGLFNIQFVINEGNVYVIEVNPRSSRTVPFLSKITGIPLAKIATKVILGDKLSEMGYVGGLWPEADDISVKVPVFSFAKLRDVDITLGPEMKSTGEVMGKDKSFAKALYKGLLGAGMNIPTHGKIVVTVADKDKQEVAQIIKGYVDLGFEILATSGTASYFESLSIPVTTVNKLHEGSPNILEMIRSGNASMVINTLTIGKKPERDGFRIRRDSVENGVPCLTSLDTAAAILTVLQTINFSVHAIEYK